MNRLRASFPFAFASLVAACQSPAPPRAPEPVAAARVISDQPESKAPAAPKGVHVTFLHTNDEHSRLVPFKAVGEPELGGAVRRKAIVDRIRRERKGGPVFLFSGGDYAQGTLAYDVWEGSAEIMAMNAIGYDAITLGNHQFDLGVASLGRSLAGGTLTVGGAPRAIEAAAMPVVVSNLDVAAEPALKGRIVPRAIVERGGVKIGIVGAITDTLPKIVELPPTVKVLTTGPSVQAQIDALTAEGIDKIVLVSHSGSASDIANVAQLAGVDVVVSGHDHAVFGNADALAKLGLTAQAKKVKRPYPFETKGKDGAPVLVVSAGEWGRFVGRLDVDFDAAGRVSAWVGEPQVVACDDPKTCDPVDEAFAHKLAEYMQPVDAIGGRVLTQSDRRLHADADDESELAHLMAEATLHAARSAGATIALAEGDFRADLEAGPVTYAAAHAAWPFTLRIVVVDLTGAELTEVALAWLRSDEARPGLAGLRIDASLASGEPRSKLAIRSITSGAKRIDPATHYRVAVDSYMTALSGDPVLTRACARGGCRDTGIVQRDALIDELARAKSIPRIPAGRLAIGPAAR
jgi:5'-nucleotidase